MKITPIQTNFTAGELTPKLYGRGDIDRYHNGAEALENVIILVQGGVRSRYGLRYTAPAKHHDKDAELIPYVFNRQQRYMLELGDAYLRVYLDNGAQVQQETSPGVFVPYEIQTDYAEADLSTIEFVQRGDTMFLFHEAYPTRRLRRFGDASWVLDDVPWVTQPFAEIGVRPTADITISDPAVGTGRTITATSSVFLAADVGRDIEAVGGLARITAVAGTTATVDVLAPFASTSYTAGQWLISGSPMATVTPSAEKPVGQAITLTLDKAGFRASDVGSWIDMSGGLVRITGVTSATSATGIIHREMAAPVAVPPLAWLLQAPVWGGANGYPRTGTFFEQRLWLGGSPGFPQTVWGSRIGEYLDFELGTNDDDAVSFILASDQQNQILHLSQLRILLALTNGGEFTLQGSLDKPITPTNVQIRSQSAFGSSVISPERVGNELLFVQRAGRKIRALSADRIDSDQYGAPELTVLADHMTAAGIRGTAYAAEPDSLLHCVRTDGQLATCTVDRDQEVVGWSRQITAGRFLAVATLPGDDADQVWAIVERQVGGQPRRYIEQFDADLLTDCAVTATSDAGDTVWLGLDHLEGLTVKVKADGVELTDQVVSGGQITIERPARAIEIGLGFTPRVKMLRPEAIGATGSIQSSNVRISEITLRFLESAGAKVNGQTIFARQTGLGVLDRPPPLLTGDERIEQLGWGLGDFNVEIVQPHPYPFHLQAVITTMTVNQ